MLNSLSAGECAFFMQRFLKFAYKNPFFTLLTFLSAFFPLVLLVLFFLQRQFTGGVATLIFILLGWLLFIAGVLGITQRGNTPLYDAIARWDVENLAADWRQTQKKWYLLNHIRASAAAVALLLFLAAFLLAS